MLNLLPFLDQPKLETISTMRTQFGELLAIVAKEGLYPSQASTTCPEAERRFHRTVLGRYQTTVVDSPSIDCNGIVIVDEIGLVGVRKSTGEKTMLSLTDRMVRFGSVARRMYYGGIYESTVKFPDAVNVAVMRGRRIDDKMYAANPRHVFGDLQLVRPSTLLLDPAGPEESYPYRDASGETAVGTFTHDKDTLHQMTAHILDLLNSASV